ncbi:hypothetical protein SLS62_003482 [Diatrype stigma]|uniref:J domain-containing protein n=1 Tax=Diatrype stigma TaxID=117547 RepID=A0AAN9UWE2_9PEZI
MDPFKVLGVDPGADLVTIKQAYRRLCLEYHPDKAGQTKESHGEFIKINEAYTFLCNRFETPPKKTDRSPLLQSSESTTGQSQSKGISKADHVPPLVVPYLNVEFKTRAETDEMMDDLKAHLKEFKKIFASICRRYDTYARIIGDNTDWSMPESISQNARTARLQAQELERQTMAIPESDWEDVPEIKRIIASVSYLGDHCWEMINKLDVLDRTLRGLELAVGKDIQVVKMLFQAQAARW